MQWFAILLVAGLALPATPVRVVFLNADGATTASEFNEGDTAIIRCRADYTDAPFTSAKLERQPYGSDDRVTITNGEQIIDQLGERDRYSGANLTDIGGNTVDYRVTIEGVDRYDNGFGFYCQFVKESGESSGAGGVASKLVVNWQPPSVLCSDIPEKIQKGQDASYGCSTTDVDPKSNGSLTLWRNDEQQAAATGAASPADPVETRYSLSHTVQITDDGAKDKYVCRYRGIGGFEEYVANCTFQQPGCVVPSMSDPCPDNGAVAARDGVHLLVTMGIPSLIMLWVK